MLFDTLSGLGVTGARTVVISCKQGACKMHQLTNNLLFASRCYDQLNVAQELINALHSVSSRGYATGVDRCACPSAATLLVRLRRHKQPRHTHRSTP
jgi:hypothetical protein